MEIDQVVYVSVAALAAAWVVLAMCTMFVWSQNRRLLRQIERLGQLNRVRVQKAKVEPSSDYSYQNPNITPGEELSRRGYSMYSGGSQDVESGQSQSAHPVFIEDLIRQDSRHPVVEPPMDGRPSTVKPPAFLLEIVEENKRKTLSNPVANGRSSRKSNSNPNLIY